MLWYYAEFHVIYYYADVRYAACHYAESRCAECRGAIRTSIFLSFNIAK